MVKRSLAASFLVVALLVSVAGAACPPAAEACPMHSAKVGCGQETDDCCPGTKSAESTPFVAQQSRPLPITVDTLEVPSDLQPFLEPPVLGQHACAAAVPPDVTCLFCVLLI